MKDQKKHIEWIVENYSQALEQALLKENYSLSVFDIVEMFVQADPSKAKGAVDWLAKTYIAGGFLIEDLLGGTESKVSETLLWFGKNRKKLEGDARNLASYSTLASVYSAIKPFVTVDNDQVELSGKALKRLEKEQAFEESIILKREPNMIMAVPLTRKASEWWGRGTRWCTASTKSSQIFETNMFDKYNKDSPLIVLTFPKGLGERNLQQPSLGTIESESSKVRKFQIWVTQNSIQFMDEQDSTVTHKFVQENWSSFEPVMNWARQINPEIINFYPPHAITSAIAMDIVQCQPTLLNMIPVDLIDQPIVDCVLSFEKPSLQGIPSQFLTQENCVRAFEANDINIQWIPIELQTQQMCEQMLDKNLSWINSLNTNLLSADHIVLALNKLKDKESQRRKLNTHWGLNVHVSLVNTYKGFSDRFKTEQINNLCSEIYPAIIRYYRSQDITEQMIWRVIQNNPTSIDLIPEDRWNEQMLEFVKENHPNVIKLIPSSKLSKNLVVLALQNDQTGISWIPDHLVDLEVFEEILKQPLYLVRDFLTYMPEDQWTQPMATLAFQTCDGFFKVIPEKFRSKEWEISDQDQFKDLVKNTPTLYLSGSTGMGKGRVIRELELNEQYNMDNMIANRITNRIQMFGRVHRIYPGQDRYPVINLDEMQEDDIQRLNRMNTILKRENNEKKWDESILDGLKDTDNNNELTEDSGFKP